MKEGTPSTLADLNRQMKGLTTEERIRYVLFSKTNLSDSEVNVLAKAALDSSQEASIDMEALRAKADEVQNEMAARFNGHKKPTWGDIANWIELLNPMEETATAILARLTPKAKSSSEVAPK